ncbi:MAG: YigZ family protein, partial [Endomicrobia bacterium]|nr:YigZ family protein [Endomicrobiia bacterium]
MNSAENATEVIKHIKKKFYDATHNCYAFRLANGDIKYSDDGEPNGTAGIRILNAIKHANLFNVLIIVTR